jgi:hypothetical protein
MHDWRMLLCVWVFGGCVAWRSWWRVSSSVAGLRTKVNLKDKWKILTIRAAELFTPSQLPIAFKLLDRTQRMEKFVRSSFPDDCSGLLRLVESVLSPEALYDPLKAQFLVLPVETSAILDKTFPRNVPESIETLFNFRVCFLGGSLGNQDLLSSQQLAAVCREIIGGVTTLSWKLDKIRLETCLDQVLRVEESVDTVGLVLDVIVELIVGGAGDVELLARFIDNINSRFGFSAKGLAWIESSLLVRAHDVIKGEGGKSVKLFGNVKATKRVSKFVGLFVFASRLDKEGDGIRKGMVDGCERLFGLFQTLSKSPSETWLRFTVDIMLFYVPFINENQSDCKLVAWIECLIGVLVVESDEEDLFDSVFDVVCWLIDDVKKELKNSLLPMLRV